MIKKRIDDKAMSASKSILDAVNASLGE